MKTTHIVYLPDVGISEPGTEVALLVNSDEPTKLLFKTNTPATVNKEDLIKAMEILDRHLNSKVEIKYFIPVGSNIEYDVINGTIVVEEN